MEEKEINRARLPTGINFRTEAEVSPHDLGHDVELILRFLQSKDREEILVRIDDWLQHDGLLFENGKATYSEMIGLAKNPSELEEKMPGDTFVRIGLLSRKKWYFRIFINEEMRDEILRAEYDITLPPDFASEFESSLQNKMKCRLIRENSDTYYENISHDER
jgi:hypothetical protein